LVCALPLGALLAGLFPPARIVQPYSASVPCDARQTQFIVQIGAESMAVGTGPSRSAPLLGPLVLLPGQLEKDPVSKNEWWGFNIGDMTADTWIIFAINRQAKGKGDFSTLIWNGELPRSGSGVFGLCVGGADARKLGDFTMIRVTALQAID